MERAEAASDVDAINALEAHAWLDGPLAPEGRVGGAARDLFLAMNEIALRSEARGMPRNAVPTYDRVGNIDCPTLIAWGDLDFPDVVDNCRYLAGTIKSARRHVFAGAAHLPNLEQPDALAGCSSISAARFPSGADADGRQPVVLVVRLSLTVATPLTPCATWIARDFCSALSTWPVSVTTPFTVSTSICSALRPGSAISAVFTEPVIAASPIFAVALSAAASVFAATWLVVRSIFSPTLLGAAVAATRRDEADAGHQRGQQRHPLFGNHCASPVGLRPAKRAANLAPCVLVALATHASSPNALRGGTGVGPNVLSG
jgi:hypothetical protein